MSAQGPWTGDWTQIAAQEEALLSESLAGWREKYPEVHVDQRSVRSDPVVELLEQARTARLLVVGSRGRGGFKGMLLGSVSQRVLKRATCPVAVVHTEQPTGAAHRGRSTRRGLAHAGHPGPSSLSSHSSAGHSRDTAAGEG